MKRWFVLPLLLAVASGCSTKIKVRHAGLNSCLEITASRMANDKSDDATVAAKVADHCIREAAALGEARVGGADTVSRAERAVSKARKFQPPRIKSEG